MQRDKSERKVDGTGKPVANKLITEYFPGFAANGKKASATPGEQHETKNVSLDSGYKKKAKNMSTKRKLRDLPKWCSIPGTPFRVVNSILNDTCVFVLCYCMFPLCIALESGNILAKMKVMVPNTKKRKSMFFTFKLFVQSQKKCFSCMVHYNRSLSIFSKENAYWPFG